MNRRAHGVVLLEQRHVVTGASELPRAIESGGPSADDDHIVDGHLRPERTAGARVALARSENNLALVLMARGDLGSARRHLDRSLDLCDEADLEFGRSHVLLSLCELSMQEDKVEKAYELAQRALELAERLEEGASVAEAHVWLGRIADRRGEHDTTDREFADAIRGFDVLGMRERLLQCHGLYAEILERRGELARAYVHMKEALQATRPEIFRRAEEEERVSSA